MIEGTEGHEVEVESIEIKGEVEVEIDIVETGTEVVQKVEIENENLKTSVSDLDQEVGLILADQIASMRKKNRIFYKESFF